MADTTSWNEEPDNNEEQTELKSIIPSTPVPEPADLPTQVYPPVSEQEITLLAPTTPADEPTQQSNVLSTASVDATEVARTEQVKTELSYEYEGALPQAQAMAGEQQEITIPPQVLDNPTPVYAPGVGLYQPYQAAEAQPGTIYAPPPKQRSGLWLWLILVALAAFLIGGGSALAFTQIRNQSPAQAPQSVLQTYCQGVTSENAQEIYNLLSQNARTHTSLDDLENTFAVLKQSESELGMSISYSKCTFSDLKVSDSLAVATVSLTESMTLDGNNMSVTLPTLVSLIVEDNQWKVDFSSLASPQAQYSLPNLSGFLTPTANQ